MKRLVSLFLAGICTSAMAAQSPKNIIMIVGDGMGPAYPTAYRMFADDISTPQVEETVFDRHLVGMASTHPDIDTGYVTDSAAGATALSAGVKTYNGAIAVDVEKAAVGTVLELAKKQGRKTGVAVTSQINHATPAGYSAHNVSRQNYNEIADSYFDDKVDGKFVLDVMLGGGWKYFDRDDRNLIKEFQQAGYQYIDEIDKLDQAQPGKPLLGLFADTGLPWALDYASKQRLPALTKTAVSQLENDKGFFLLVEASQVDWAGHANDIAAAMWEMRDLAITLEWLEQYVENNPDTLVVLTADHSTGGMTIGANGNYNWLPSILTELEHSPLEIAKQVLPSADKVKLASTLLKFNLTDEEAQLVLKPTEQKALTTAIKQIIDARTITGWTTGGHTGVDVPVYALGMGREKFIGHSDNTDIAKQIFELLNAK
ncbi:alkaline phosphatase [Paraglaciecola aquimarina]|uniref:Alkaline phosphatase n=1 Tax=Paraglaciecola aquimarina TaxID=1235557 RepID=A0ABU3T291_9ALTE|nr:alkaline phosphatase [Paraglaciecola aquimarina]MDU0356333.1 alkaline phosphatase [Paraglaciecola aquimarina]